MRIHKGNRMQLQQIIEKIRSRPDADRIGMILSHTGVVRGTSRDGRPVTGLEVAVDHDKLNTLLQNQKSRQGIIDISLVINENRHLKVGDVVMWLVVAGDIRDNVIPVLSDTLNAIKTVVTQKTEFFVQGD